MDVQIETFQEVYGNDIVSPVDETEQETFNSLAKELGFENLCLDRKANPDQIRIPKLNSFELKVYETVCPNKVSLSGYREEMPLRALEALEIAKPMIPDDFDLFVLKATEDPDPVLIASRYSWLGSESIMIARWGKELIDFPSLAKRAEEILETRMRAELIRMRAIAESFNSDPQGYCKGILTGRLKLPELKED